MRPVRLLPLVVLALVGAFTVGSIVPSAHAAGDKDKAGQAKKEAAGRKATVTDEFGVDMEVEAAALFAPSSGLLSSGKGKQLEELTLHQGAHEILVAPERIASIEVSGPDGEYLKVTLKLKGGESAEGGVDRALEIRGTVALGGYRVSLSRAKRVVFRG